MDQLPGRLEQQGWCIVAVRGHECCLGTEQLGTSTSDIAEGPRLRRVEQAERVIERAGAEFRLGGSQRALRAPRRVGGQRDGALEECRGGAETAARLCSVCGTFQFRRHLLVRPGRGLRPVPGAAIRVDLRIGRFRKCAVDVAALIDPGRAVHGRAHQWMTEHHTRTERDQTVRFDGAGGRLCDSEPLSRPPHKAQIAGRIGRGHEQ
jgi:hypothetical protein